MIIFKDTPLELQEGRIYKMTKCQNEGAIWINKKFL